MDHETNKQEPSGTEGGKVKNPKVGDWVWVKGQIKNTKFGATETEVEICEQRVYVRIFDCRPVDPVIKESLTTESNCPEVPDSSSEPMRVAFEAEMVQYFGWDQSCFSRSENRYSDAQVEIIWQSFQSGAKYGDAIGHPEPTDREPQCERDLWWGTVIDPINPAHYKQGGIECIEAIEAALGKGFSSYLRGNVIKYLWRYDKKGGVDDLRKALWYLDQLIKEVGE
jgi:hypothetical protein